ncbi:DEAD/DEAH box helicase [Sporocytophaga myxococcoides]|uniref:DEAD/DEAH box helicase n=1 Tax=Sporocytophaga myxococcoides TaxID=153721 RepID=A0A098LCV4_9BACT|nr:DEAD/DEAH box helicase [Sporocytophaga myxococcoides]GAL84198.1 DEAD/DEAH box helicase [Sporocytophaga myxococcoides]
MSFNSLGLSLPLIKGIEKQYQTAYPIQQQAIPVILSGKDVLGIAQTGSGKTASFVLPVLDLLQNKIPSRNRYVKVLALVPTRELAVQVSEVFQQFSSGLPEKLKTLAVYGGVSINPQMMAMSGTDILVATPGRLLELIDNNAVFLSDVRILILDEADKMLNLGFEEEMNRVFKLLPKQRQTILFSATLGEAVNSIKENFLKDPVTIEIKKDEQSVELIKQLAYHVHPDKKGVLLRYLIKSRDMQQVLVFVSSKKRADNVVVKLNKNGIEAAAIHGDKSQGARMDALKKFKTGKLRVLVATDIAARGIDIQFLPFVINYELPRSPIDYVHRIGRTGRAESPGEAITLLYEEDHHHFGIIQKKMKKQVPIIDTNELDLKGY